MSVPLAGKVALVTGASRGIGRAIAEKLARAGCDVAVGYFNSHAEARALASAIEEQGRRAVTLQVNVASPESIAGAFTTLREQFPRIDFVVSNAASGVLKPALAMSLKHWHWCLDTNAFALQGLAQHALPMMPPHGRIIALSSLGAQRTLPDYGFIAASKAALESLVRTLAVELAPHEIRVNAVSAGLVDTDALKAFPGRGALLAETARRSPVCRTLTPAEVADAVYLLCLPEAEMINGQTIVVDGGYSVVG
jgi:enoyl-[acyl-carrier protein] reductase III